MYMYTYTYIYIYIYIYCIYILYKEDILIVTTNNHDIYTHIYIYIIYYNIYIHIDSRIYLYPQYGWIFSTPPRQVRQNRLGQLEAAVAPPLRQGRRGTENRGISWDFMGFWSDFHRIQKLIFGDLDEKKQHRCADFSALARGNRTIELLSTREFQWWVKQTTIFTRHFPGNGK